jgi:hypothetical protein
MSQLQKTISRLQRREGPGIGFAPVHRDQPKAMALIATVGNAGEAKAALEAGADAVLFQSGSASIAAGAMKEVTGPRVAAGAALPVLSVKDAETLAEAGCDFVISPLETTDSAAVDTERMGHLVNASENMEDNTLRALAPLGLDALFVQRSGGSMKLGEQLGLVRIASFASTGLMVTIPSSIEVADLRVLRDSGTVAVVAPPGASASELTELVERLKAVPPPRKGKREGNDIAIVPTSKGGGDHDHDDDDGDDD